MQRVKIVLEGKDPNGNPFLRENILPSSAIESTQKIYGQSIKRIVPVDENGNELKEKIVNTQSRSSVARAAMERILKERQIDFKDSMNDDQLLKLVQRANTNPTPEKFAPVVVKKAGRPKKVTTSAKAETK